MVMLLELVVQDLAIIQDAKLTLGPGFNVVSGETGAGKSLLVDALNVVLGARAERDLVRFGAQRASVEAVFQFDRTDSHARTAMAEYGVEIGGEGTITLSREVYREGRSVCRINGRQVPVRLVRSIGSGLAEIYGQGSQVSMMEPARQLALVDQFAGVCPIREQMSTAIADVRRLRAELEALTKEDAAGEQRRAFLNFQVDEIERTQLRDGEEEALVQELALLTNATAIRTASSEAYVALCEGDDSALDQLARATKALAQAPDPAGIMTAQIAALSDAQTSLEDAARTIRSYGEAADVGLGRLTEIEDRLAVLRALTRRHGGTIESILAFAAAAQREIDDLNNLDASRTELAQSLAAAETWAGKQAWKLSKLRQAASHRLSSSVDERLTDLAMAGARFQTSLTRHEADDGIPVENEKRYAFSLNGIDEVEFQVAMNVGDAALPLSRTASGGEASRLLLAIAGVLAAGHRKAPLVFDEIDAGVGGRTGDAVGRNLWALAQEGQVLCVTHLPQIAAYADRHVRIVKGLTKGRTTTKTEPLGAHSRLEEISAMLGGGQAMELNAAARLLLEQANGYKLADVALATSSA